MGLGEVTGGEENHPEISGVPGWPQPDHVHHTRDSGLLAQGLQHHQDGHQQRPELQSDLLSLPVRPLTSRSRQSSLLPQQFLLAGFLREESC